MRTKQVSGIGKRGLAGTGALAAAAAGILLLSDPVSAQTAPAATEDVETVVVTGSHITTPGFEAPTPVTSLSDATIKQAGALNAQALETQIPQLAPNVFAQQSNGNPGQSTFNLRNLGTTRTLLLLDGQRLMPTSYDGSTDANIIPLSLIKRFDVVTGGASAAYGSDAVAGVVNIVLDNDYEGLKGNVQAGESQYHDNKEFDASLTGGVAFDGGRGHLVVSGEIYGNGGSDFGTGRRPWARQGWWEGANPNYVAGVANGQTQFLVMPNALFSAMTNGGLIDTGPLKGIYFGPGGAPQAMTYGKNVGPTFMQGGSGDSIWQYGSITPVLNRASIYTHASYDIAPDLSAWTGVMYVHSEASSPITPNYQNSGAINVSINNPYLPASIVALMNADHVTSFGMGRMDTDLGFNEADGSYSYLLWRGGLKGTAFDSWSWDLTGQYSTNDYLYKSPNNENVQHFNNAVNVVTNPANGLPICASTLVTPGDGCIPTNIFGPTRSRRPSAPTSSGTSWNRYMLESWDFVGNVQGVLFKNWAGDVSLAAGGEVRRNSLNSTADPGSIAKIWRINNVQPFRGAETDEEGYIESDVPLLKGLAFVKSFDIDGAYRYTNYDISGKAETWKIGANYAFDDDLRFRLTTSRDIRAPNLNDLFSTSGSNVGQAVDYQAPAGTPGCAGLTCNETINYGTGGNINLKPEVGLTITGGVVYSPSWLDGFQASVDYWQIHLHNAITSPGPQDRHRSVHALSCGELLPQHHPRSQRADLVRRRHGIQHLPGPDQRRGLRSRLYVPRRCGLERAGQRQHVHRAHPVGLYRQVQHHDVRRDDANGRNRQSQQVARQRLAHLCDAEDDPGRHVPLCRRRALQRPLHGGRTGRHSQHDQHARHRKPLLFQRERRVPDSQPRKLAAVRQGRQRLQRVAAGRRQRHHPAADQRCRFPGLRSDRPLLWNGPAFRLLTLQWRMVYSSRRRSVLRRRFFFGDSIMHRTKVAIIDDYAGAALALADWSQVAARAEITVFDRHLAADEIAETLKPFEVICTLRERTAFDAPLFARLPNLKALVVTDARVGVVDNAAAAAHGVLILEGAAPRTCRPRPRPRRNSPGPCCSPPCVTWRRRPPICAPAAGKARWVSRLPAERLASSVWARSASASRIMPAPST